MPTTETLNGTQMRGVGAEALVRCPSEDHEIVRRLTAAMREADRAFEGLHGGGSTRHHVRDCLLPILAKHGLSVSCI